MSETNTIDVVHFSDSIIIFSKNDSLSNYIDFTNLVTAFYSSALTYKIPLKGSFAYGEISIDKSKKIYFGQAVIDAVLLQEDVNYMGIVAHHSIDLFLKNNLTELLKSNYFEAQFFEEKTPLKSGNVNHLNLNWFTVIVSSIPHGNSHTNEEDVKIYIEEIISNFKYNATGYHRKYIDNTIDFFRESLKNKKINLLDSLTPKK